MIPFMRFRWVSISFSAIALLVVFYYTDIVHQGFKQGIDFAGGIKIELNATDKITKSSLGKFFESEKIDVVITESQKEKATRLLVQIGFQGEQQLTDLANKNSKLLTEQGLTATAITYISYNMKEYFKKDGVKKIEFLSNNSIGPAIGDSLRKDATRLLLIALVLITVYVAFRFKINFAFGAMIALLHDLFLTLGIIGFLQVELSVPVIAALLTILGYSINDTIVIFDRIRENDSSEEKLGFQKIVDRSITESLTRTIITSVTTLIAVLSVFFLGGSGLRDMSLVLILGIIIGTYSSTFIASPVVVISNSLARKA